MKITRVFTDPNGISRFEDLDLSTHPDLREPRPATGVYLREFPAGTVLALHPAPRRQLVVIVTGTFELDVGHESRRFGPGDVRLMEDTTGRGHTTRVIGDEAALVVVVPLVPPT